MSYLAIADIGDNFRWRQELAIHIVAEPDVRTEAPSDVPLTVAWTIRYEYPDGPHDAESIAVDVDSQELLVLTKRSVPVQMFRLPLRPVADVVTATHLLDVLLPQPSPLDLQQDPDFGAFRSMPTGMDAGAAGVVIVTPLDAYYWPRIEEESVAALLAQPPRRVPLPRMSQIESVCFDATGRSFFITSERRKGIDIADLFEVMID